MLWFAAAVLTAATYSRPEMLVSTEWLASHLNDPNIRIVDMRRTADDYAAGHVPNAVYLANEAIRDANAPPTFLPTPAAFEALMGRLGVTNRTRVIAYDERGGVYAARLWWILNQFGHSNVALLDGGWVKWKAEQRTAATDTPAVASAAFRATPNPRWVATADDVKAAIGKRGTKIVDARTQAEIEGRELRGIKRGGYIATSIPLYWEDLLDPVTKAFKPAADLERMFTERGLVPSDEIITYCQIGMRASVDLFALHLMGYDRLRNYYGSWEEWGNRDDTPIETKTPPKERQYQDARAGANRRHPRPTSARHASTPATPILTPPILPRLTPASALPSIDAGGSRCPTYAWLCARSGSIPGSARWLS